jgi:hypothetical protein
MIEIAATVNENKFGILSVTNSEQVKAGLDGILIVNGKRALVTRGSSPMAVVGQVFTRFAQECDQTGEPFAFSRERRGSVERDPVFHSIFKVTPVRMREYVLSWFQPCELVQATNGPMMSTAGEHGWVRNGGSWIQPVTNGWVRVGPSWRVC